MENRTGTYSGNASLGDNVVVAEFMEKPSKFIWTILGTE